MNFFFFWKIWKSWILSRNWKNLIDDFFWKIWKSWIFEKKLIDEFFFFFGKIWKSWILSRNWKKIWLMIFFFFFLEKFGSLEFFKGIEKKFDCWFFFFFFLLVTYSAVNLPVWILLGSQSADSSGSSRISSFTIFAIFAIFARQWTLFQTQKHDFPY